MILSNITVRNLGTFSLTDLFGETVFDKSRLINRTVADIPIFDTYFRGDYFASLTATPSQLTVTQLNISDIGKYKGVPVFRVTQVHLVTTDELFNNISITRSVFSNLQSDEVQASIVLDATRSSKNLNIMIADCTFERLFSVKGLVSSRSSLKTLSVEGCRFTGNTGLEAALFSV